jgi:hypothetical protein
MSSLIILIISQRPTSRQIALEKALLELHLPADFVVSGLCNLSSILFLIAFRIRSILGKSQSLSILIGNNIPYASILLRLIFPSSRIIADLGYPITDIPDITLWRRALYLISDTTMLFSSTRVLLESSAQVSRFSNFFNILPVLSRKFYPFLVHASSKTQSASFSCSDSFELINPCDPYFLFRGRLNEESGINILLSALREFSLLPTHCQKPRLTVLGYGKYTDNCTSLASTHSDYFYYIDQFIPSDLLKAYTLKTLFCIGQLNSTVPRLRYTVPHKFYEAMSLNKPYFTPLYPPFLEFIRQEAILCFEITNSWCNDKELIDIFPFLLKYPAARDFIDILSRLMLRSSVGSSQYPLVMLLPSDQFDTFCFDINRKSIEGF